MKERGELKWMVSEQMVSLEVREERHAVCARACVCVCEGSLCVLA